MYREWCKLADQIRSKGNDTNAMRNGTMQGIPMEAILTLMNGNQTGMPSMDAILNILGNSNQTGMPSLGGFPFNMLPNATRTNGTTGSTTPTSTVLLRSGDSVGRQVSTWVMGSLLFAALACLM
jgi:hypothetical protein